LRILCGSDIEQNADIGTLLRYALKAGLTLALIFAVALIAGCGAENNLINRWLR